VNIKLNENWLRWAVQIEDEADCDISAGLDYGQNLDKYLELLSRHERPISHVKFLEILTDEVGIILSKEEIEKLADEFQFKMNEALVKKPIAA